MGKGIDLVIDRSDFETICIGEQRVSILNIPFILCFTAEFLRFFIGNQCIFFKANPFIRIDRLFTKLLQVFTVKLKEFLVSLLLKIKSLNLLQHLFLFQF